MFEVGFRDCCANNSAQALEVGSPNAGYELVVKTSLGKGTAIPKGRYSLPRETKKASNDKILVFAEGRVAEEARRAGADIVGGPELADGVRALQYDLLSRLMRC